jgi:hypothetical protein
VILIEPADIVDAEPRGLNRRIAIAEDIADVVCWPRPTAA